jgi:hypothetical protein
MTLFDHPSTIFGSPREQAATHRRGIGGGRHRQVSYRASQPAFFVASALACLAVSCGKEKPAKETNTSAVAAPVIAASSAEATAPTADPEQVKVRFVVPHMVRCGGAVEHDDILDDFEDGDGLLPRIGDRTGSWYIASDGTPGGTVRPAVGAASPERLAPARCQSSFATHFTGRGFTAWGALLGVNLHFDQVESTANLSDYRGVRFWARAGEQNGCALRITLDDVSTHPAGHRCSKAPDQGRPCWNSYGVDIPTLSNEWTELAIPFSEMTQKIPESTPVPLDLKHIYQLVFKMSPTGPFDIWIDDVAFFR